MADERKPETKTTVTETSAVKPNEDGATAYPNGKGKFSPWWFLILLAPLLLLLMIMYRNNKANNTDTTTNTVAPVTRNDNKPVDRTIATPGMAAADSTAAMPGSGGSMAGVPDSAGMVGDGTADAATTTSPDAVAGTSGAGSGAPGKDTKVFSGKDIATGGTATASSKGEPLSDVTDFTNAADRMALVGRNVKLTDVNVQRVLTDRAYFVGADENSKLLVLLDKDMNAGAGPQRVKIMPGHKVSLTGILQPVPTAEIANEQYGLGAPNYNAIANEQVYLHVTVAQKK